MAHIFISYSHKDAEYAHALAASLQGMGFEVWIDQRLDYGSQWPQELQKQLDSCSAFILIMSPRSYTSEWVQSELQRARRKLKPVFPLLLEGDEPWLSVESTQFYDVRGEVYPDSKFYTALKNVMSATPVARTLQIPKGSLRKKLIGGWSRLGIGISIVVIGILLLFVIGYAAMRMRLATQSPAETTLPAAQPTSGEVPAEDPTSAPASTSAPQPTQPSQNANPGDYEMALVPAGEFTMGGKAAEEVALCLENFESDCQLNWFMDEEPVQTVYLDAFYI
ncbi:MAG: TIR domain-containing protein, partial [Anaerolineales bacterium]